MADRNGHLTVKDLITTGLFAALYIVIISVVGFLGVIPIFVPLAAVITPLLGGIPLMLFLTKVRKFGMVLILSLLVGLMMFIGGMGPFSILTSLIFGLASEFILKSGGYKSARLTIIGYAVQSMWIIGNFLPFIFMRDSFLAQQASNYGSDYAAQLSALTPEWSIFILAIAAFIAGLGGALVGRKIYRKHFEQAGIL